MSLASLSSRAIRGYLFHELQNTPDDWVTDLCGPVLPSDQDIETYVGSAAVAGLRQWVGQRLERNLKTYQKAITNVKYEDTLYVYGEEWRRDKTGQVMMRIDDLVQRYQQHWAELATTTLVTPGTAYDGVNFFATTHAESGTNQANQGNLTAANGTVPTNQEMADGIMTCIAALTKLKDNEGKPINIGATDWSVMVTPDLLGQLTAALGASILSNGTAMNTNVLTLLGGYRIKPVVNPYLTDATVMYVYRNNGRSFIRQQEWGPLIQEQAEGSPIEMTDDKHVYGVATSRGIGCATWSSIYKATWT